MTPPLATAAPDGSAQVESLLDSTESVSIEEAVRQRVHLHPQAHAQDIAAMLELAGVQPPLEVVQRVLDEYRSETTSEMIDAAPPAPRPPR